MGREGGLMKLSLKHTRSVLARQCSAIKTMSSITRIK
jgi:hypothetical protein